MIVDKREYWRGKTVIVTGASGGLGLSIAEAFVKAGANVVLAARSAGPLEAAVAKLAALGQGAVLGVPTDVLRDDDVENLVARSIERFGRIDALVNNAGLSMRKAVLETTVEECREMMELNFLALVRCTRATAPQLLANRGHLVNIGSLSGKSASRWLGGYPASKFAVTAYSQQLRLELEPQGLHVLLVCPGPIARDDDRVRSPEELAKLPPEARKPGGGVKTSRIRPEMLAAKIVTACESRRRELIVPWYARIIFTLMQTSPTVADWLVRKLT
ncbi:MAG: SDR family NAD(P)-dependent oxidoreductase [Planctomycetales bacterium]|nr:SDR family NAD(P)-dependent oxidoreductase [Planctomycetales bacterium]MBN8624588.1 SDR family NAD(P)-dependent oxidoreductase [Planctomycetota bacterium]